VAQAVQFPHDDFGDRYAIERELGHGATASVYLARDLKFEDKLVAIKVLSADFALPVPSERFLREIETTAKLNHPHIVTLMESGRTRGAPRRPFYVMRYIDGETLRDILARGPLAVDDALRIARQVAGALGHAHRHGVIHRDIKPGNIMLEDGHTWVTDFGIARAMAAKDGQTVTSTGVTIGTPAYMSPEQAMGRGDLDARSDIYSLGCVLYEMLAGKMPFEGPDIQVVLHKHLVEPLPPLRELRPDAPERVEQLLDIALAKKREDRFATAVEFAEALSLEGAGALTPTRTQPVRGERRQGIRWKARTAMAGGITLAAGVLVVAAWALTRPTLKLDRILVVPGWEYGEGVSRTMDAGRLLQDQLNQWKGITVMGALDSAASRRPAAAARQVEAAWYIRGDVSRVADSVRVRAQLYGARGDALVRERSINLPLTMTGADLAFSRLADQLVFDDTVWAANGGRAGTLSVAARHAFARGLEAVQTWSLADADSAFRQAGDADPSYSQAHLWLAQVRFWNGAKSPIWQSYAERAAAGRGRLSARDARVSDALLAIGRGDRERGWRVFDRLAADAPYDFSAWYGLATSLHNDDVVVRDPTSPSRWSFRSSYYRATKAYQRAFQLLPAIHRALSGSSFTSVRSLLLTSGGVLRLGYASSPGTTLFAAYADWRADTLALVPYRPADLPVPRGLRLAVQKQRELFNDIATSWVASYPNSASALQALAVSLSLLANPAALDTLRRARSLSLLDDERLRLAVDEVWMRLKFSVPHDVRGIRSARALADSLLLNAPAQTEPGLLSTLATLTGRATLAAALMRRPAVATEWDVPGPLVSTALPLTVFSALGGPIDSIRILESAANKAIQAMAPAIQAEVRARWISRPAALAFPVYRFESLSELRGPHLPVLDAQYALISGDTLRVRTVLADRGNARTFLAPGDISLDVLYPEAWLFLQLGDPRAALAWLDPTLRSLPATGPQMFADPAMAGALVRAMMLRAKLADQLGDSSSAAEWRTATEILLSDSDDFLRALISPQPGQAIRGRR